MSYRWKIGKHFAQKMITNTKTDKTSCQGYQKNKESKVVSYKSHNSRCRDKILLWSGYFSVCWTISKIRQSKKNHSFASYSKFFGISEYLNMSVFYVFILFWIMVLASMTSFDKHLRDYVWWKQQVGNTVFLTWLFYPPCGLVPRSTWKIP